MPKVITVINILKIKARASCHSAVYRPGPAGRSPRLFPTPVSDVLAGWKIQRTAEGSETEKKAENTFEVTAFRKQTFDTDWTHANDLVATFFCVWLENPTSMLLLGPTLTSRSKKIHDV